MAIDITKIAPDSTGKFSPALHKFLVRSPRFVRAYQKLDDWNGKTEHGDWRITNIIIASDPRGLDDGFISGVPLRQIVCEGKKEVFAYPLHWLRDVTEAFWADYLSMGRCAWDKRHIMGMQSDDHRISAISKEHHVCNWCGQHMLVQAKRELTWKKSRSLVMISAGCSPATANFPYGSMGEEVRP
jgi:hypothetical protein